MPHIVAVLFENKIEESYVAIRLDSTEPEIIFSKGPSFIKTMGPFPVPYAEATIQHWKYLRVINPPEVSLNPASLRAALVRMRTYDEHCAEYVAGDSR